MAKIHESTAQLVGHTPLLRLNGYAQKHGINADIIAKLEYYNPNQSVKDRIAFSIIDDAEKRGLLKPGDTIVDVTSGNTGIALASVAAAKGYKFRVYIQDNVSEERFKVIRAFGGETIRLSDEPRIAKAMAETGGDFVALIKAVKEVIAGEEHLFFADQTYNPANPGIHESTTGPEIWEDTNGDVDIFVACVGTGGTVSGVGSYLKSKNPNIKIVAVQPAENSIATAENPDVEEITGVHPFEGVPESFIPGNLNREIYDDWIPVETQEAYAAAREVARTDGILVGTSSGAALQAARVLAQRPENKGKKIVAVFPDTGLRYLSTNLFE